MAREVYRVEIPIEATDNYSAEIRKAEHSVTQFEAAMKRSTSMADKRRNDFNRGKWSMTLKAVDRASGVASRASAFIHRVANRSYRFTLRARDMASRAIGGVRRALTSIPAMITVALSVIGAGKLKEATVGAAMSFEQYEVSMQHWLGGNEKKAKNLVKWMGQFADTTPFSSVDLFPALTRGLGVSNGDVKQAQDLLKLSADMAALTPEKSVSDAMEALADAQMGEMERLKEFNVKLSKKEFDKIGYAGVIEQLSGKFEGGAKKLSQTSEGIISTLKGYRSSLFRSIGEGFLDPMKPRLDGISKWLENNQDTWGRWKSTVKGHGKQASEFIFSNIENGFGHVRERYLDNKEFMDLSFKGKVDFVMGDINEWWSSKGKPGLDGWWDGTGKPWASKIGLSIGEAIFEGIKLGITKGLEGLGDMWGNVGETAKENGIFSKETATSAGGAGIATLGAGAIGAMLLSPLLKVIAAPFKAGKWLMGKLPKGKTQTPPIVPSTTKPSTGTKPPVTPGPLKVPKAPKGPVIVDQHGRPIRSTPAPTPRTTPTPKPVVVPKQSTKFLEKLNPKNWKLPKGWKAPETKVPKPPKVKLPKGIDKLGKFGKRIPLLSAILGTAAIVGAPKGEKAKAVGGVGGAIAGGAAGAAGGAAIGSAVPIVGTAIGGLIGGIGGSILGGKGGETIGDWAGKKFGARKAEAAEMTPSGSAPTSSGEPGKMPDFSELNQHAQALTASVSGMASKAEVASHNIEAITMTLGESAGWVAGAFYPLQGATEGLTHNIDALTMTIGESAGWMAGAFYPLQGATEGLVHNISAMTMVTGEASGWIVGSFYPLQGTTEGLVHNISAITMTLGESAGWIVGAFYPLSGAGAMLTQNTTALGITLGESTAIVASSYLPLAGSGAMVNQNTTALGMVLGLSSAVVAGAYMPLAGAGPMLTGNTMALAMTLGMASGWVASLNGIQSGAAAVKGALSNLAARIASVPTPSVSVGGGAPSGGRGGPKAYASGGFINRPHLGLVGEAGPEMIIPLSSGRRGRAMDLFNQTASMLGVRPYAEGGLAGLEPIVPGYGDSGKSAMSLAGSMAGTITQVGGAVSVSAPITVEINGGQADEKMIRDIVVNYSREFVDKLREALNNMSR